MSAIDAHTEHQKPSRRKFGFSCCRGGVRPLQTVRAPKSQWESRRAAKIASLQNAQTSQDAEAVAGNGESASTERLLPKSSSQVADEIPSSAQQNTLVAQAQRDPRLSLYPHMSPEDLQDLLRLHEQFKGPLLGPQRPHERGRKTLVLDLDETLVHSSFQPVAIAAFVIPVEIETLVYEIYVAKRPGVDEFLSFCAELYEVVIFTASLGKYAGPLLDKIDPDKKCPWRLYRDACLLWQGNYVKDLSKLGRDLKDVLIVDNSPASSILQPDNAIPIRSWFDDPDDRELYELMPILRALSRVDDIQAVMRRTATCDSDDESDLGSDHFERPPAHRELS